MTHDDSLPPSRRSHEIDWVSLPHVSRFSVEIDAAQRISSTGLPSTSSLGMMPKPGSSLARMQPCSR